MRLTPKQRRRLLSGEWPDFELQRKEDCPEGEVDLEHYGRQPRVPVVTLIWTGPVKRDGRWWASYKLIDLRGERFVSKRLGYTQNPSEALDREAGEAVPADWQEKRSIEAQGGITLHQMQQRGVAEKIRLERRLLDARLGRASPRTIRAIERHRNSRKRSLGEAA